MTPEPDENVVIICHLTTVPLALKTATIGNCADCGQKVWVAPSSTRVMQQKKHPQARLICTVCAIKLMEEQTVLGEEIKIETAPGFKEEMIDQLKKNRSARNN